jgi:hypothetical protein
MDRLADHVRSELARFGPQAGLADLVARWPEAVGETIARNAWPARISRDGTLHISAADAIWAFELGHRGTEIAERLGVPRVRFAPGSLPGAEPEARPTTVPRPSQGDIEEAAALTAGIEEENLRQSVQKALVLSLARRSPDRPN